VRFQKVARYDVTLALLAVQIVSHPLCEVGNRGGSLALQYMTLHILVEHLVRAQLQAVARQPDHPELLDTLLQLCPHQHSPMRRRPSDDRADFAITQRRAELGAARGRKAVHVFGCRPRR
jgi:hypothetical protein